MKRTTVFLEENLLVKAQRYARKNGVSFATLVREALATYLATGNTATARLPSFAGQFESGRSDTSSRVDELLWSDPHA